MPDSKPASAVVASAVAEAWRTAAKDLGIAVTGPFVVRDDRTGAFEFIVLVHQFGTAAGTLVALLGTAIGDAERLAKDAGYVVSRVNPDSYSEYLRQRFIDTLNDWGYFGEDPPPDWYAGEPWS